MRDTQKLARRSLMLFVAQRPTLDPRVDWVASSASRDFEVTVHGLHFEEQSYALPTDLNGYQIKTHLKVTGTTKLIAFFWHLLTVMPLQNRLVVYLSLLCSGPALSLIAIPWVGIRVIRRALRLTVPALTRLKSAFPILSLPFRYGYQCVQYMSKISRHAKQVFVEITKTRNILGLISMLGGHMAPATAAFWQAVRKCPKKPHAVHCCDLDTLLVGVLAKRKYGCTLIYDAHEYWPYTDPNWPAPIVSFYRYLEQLLIRQADHAVTVNPLLAETMRSDYGLKCIHSVPNAAPWTEIKETIEPGVITQLAAGRTKFLFQGGIGPERGLEELLDAWAAVDPSKAALFIRAPDSVLKEQLLHQAVKAGLAGKSVYFLDSIDESSLINAAREADVGLIPYRGTLINHRLACPNKLSQYMHAGLMVISSDIPFVQSVVAEARAGVSFASGSREELLAAINTAIARPDLLAEYKKNALCFAKESFNWDRYYPVLKNLYDSHLPTSNLKSDIGPFSSGLLPLPTKDVRTVLVLYFTRGVYPLRSTNRSHLYCWEKHSRHRVVYINVALGFPDNLIKLLNVDLIIFHTMFLSMRWTPAIFRKHVSNCYYLKTISCLKIMMPQDEFLQTELLNDFCNEFGVTHILTNAKENDWGNIYGRVDRKKVHLRTILTGYIDPETLEIIKTLKLQHSSRSIDIGYRAWRAEYWLGEHGMHKTRIAAIFKTAADRLGLKSDISLEEKDVIAGDKWFDYLLDCKATIGVEGGASVLDRNGLIKEKVAAFLNSNPAATFEEARAHCFPDEDGNLDLACISPRHLEACATETVQFLVEGSYNDILIPWRHYIPIKKDYSNVEEALKIFSRPERMREIALNAQEEIIGSGKWSYPAFVQNVEATIIDRAPRSTHRSNNCIQFAGILLLKANDLLNWGFIRTERWCVRKGLKTRIGRWIYAHLISMKGSY